jgi:hypothetical protein
MKRPMKDPLAKTAADFDGTFATEESSVRARAAEPRGAARESIGERSARIDAKIRAAEHLLTRLAPTDHRLRLLCSAILRRDEVLLDAILAGKSGLR